jgi:hypothetical protein
VKFQKGLLDEVKPAPAPAVRQEVVPSPAAEIKAEVPPRQRPVFVEKEHLFETVQKTGGSARKYLTVLGIVAVFVIIGGIVLSYLTLPKAGDKVLGPQGLEQALRDHFQLVEKRTATDIDFYYCESFYWARVGVEKRPDIKTNPIYLVDKYKAAAQKREDGTWNVISATPITSPDQDQPCR